MTPPQTYTVRSHVIRGAVYDPQGGGLLYPDDDGKIHGLTAEQALDFVACGWEMSGGAARLAFERAAAAAVAASHAATAAMAALAAAAAELNAEEAREAVRYLCGLGFEDVSLDVLETLEARTFLGGDSGQEPEPTPVESDAIDLSPAGLAKLAESNPLVYDGVFVPAPGTIADPVAYRDAIEQGRLTEIQAEPVVEPVVEPPVVEPPVVELVDELASESTEWWETFCRRPWRAHVQLAEAMGHKETGAGAAERALWWLGNQTKQAVVAALKAAAVKG